MKKIVIYDTTLRDGSQSEGISFSARDKVLIAKKIDETGFHYIEGGWPGANPKDIAFFEEAKKIKFKNSKLAAFGSTRRANVKASDDENLRGLIASDTEVITIFGKSWDMHVREVFKVELEENIRMISDSVKFLRSKGREVIYDAEHFFDGYKANRAYAMKAIGAALDAGASTIVLCDTNGGTVFTEVSKIVAEVKAALKCPIGIHTHNDGSLAVANALAAVEAGATHVQGTVNGLGERCGNADLVPIIADLQLKMGYSCLSAAHLKELTELARYVSEVSNMAQARNQPYAGMSAFAHKGGVHINAVMKNPETYEHIDPALVGNHRRFLVSELGGKTNITLKAKELAIDLDKESPEARKILQKVQEKENEGYQYEAAEASFELLVREVTGKRKKFFEIVEATVSQEDVGNPDTTVKAKVTVKVKGDVGKGSATGDGPVNALDNALRKALEPFFPAIQTMKLADFKVRVVNSDAGTAAKVRVTIESRDEAKIWTTIGVSTNVIDASWQALVDAIEYKLIQP